MEPTDVGYCPHCGNTTPQELVSEMVHLHCDDGSHQYFLTRCGTCLEALLYRFVDPDDSMPETSHGRFKIKQYQLVWPESGTLGPSVPVAVRRCYEEASAIKGRAPNAFANQIRRALEALCKDRGTTNRVLAQNLQELVRRGEIPPTLAEMTEVLRKLGNVGSHAGDDEVSAEYVDVIDDFFRAVVEYVYVAPQKVSEFRTRLEQVKTDPVR